MILACDWANAMQSVMQSVICNLDCGQGRSGQSCFLVFSLSSLPNSLSFVVVRGGWLLDFGWLAAGTALRRRRCSICKY
jgi:hypothetical protein